MSQDPRDIDPDDFFQETRMSFGDHLEDLRLHLWRAIKGFFLAVIFGFIIGREVVDFIKKPVEDEGEAEVDVGRGRVDTELHAQGPSWLQLLLEAALGEDVDRDPRELRRCHGRR